MDCVTSYNICSIRHRPTSASNFTRDELGKQQKDGVSRAKRSRYRLIGRHTTIHAMERGGRSKRDSVSSPSGFIFLLAVVPAALKQGTYPQTELEKDVKKESATGIEYRIPSSRMVIKYILVLDSMLG